jgi:RTX calcium-binding nonapeptide repeat (4 copies)/WD40-like Beta Propeller Repeat
MDPDWSPDGTKIAFAIASVGHVFILELESGEVRRLTNRPPGPGSPYVCGPSFHTPEWSPDGTELALGVYTSSCNIHGNGGVLGIKSDGTGLRDIARPDSWTDAAAFSPVWAQDGSRLAIAQDPGQGTAAGLRARIEIVARGGGVLRTVRSPFAPLDWQPLCTRRGTERRDRLTGASGTDLLCGLSGADHITGGPGGDRLFGHAGNDVIRAADGQFDVVGCGAGRDTVLADSSDLVGVDCERVSRS